jgi:hypothetical protein
MSKVLSARALNTLTWEERNPSRYDSGLPDLSRWQTVVKNLANRSKKTRDHSSASKSNKK